MCNSIDRVRDHGAVKAKRLSSIVQVPEPKRFAKLAEGLELLADSVSILSEDADTLAAAKRHRGAAIVRGFADEEAAKIFIIFIILDIARAGWADVDVVNESARRFYDHLARGLYVRAYDGSPADLAEVRRYLDARRPKFFLDGPMDVDWIFGNEVLASREERLYVDLIEDEDGSRRWVGPADRERAEDSPFSFPTPASQVVRLANAMRRIGLLSEAGLAITRAVWDGVEFDDSMHWSELRPLTMEIVEALVELANGRIDPSDSDDRWALHVVLDGWIFPLTHLDLRLIEVKPADLKRAREQWLANEAADIGDAGW